MISEGQRLQYLEAMGIQVWVSRERAKSIKMPAMNTPAIHVPDQPEKGGQPEFSKPATQLRNSRASVRRGSLEIGPGSGSTLLLCSRPEDAALPLASDIARCLDEAPVWGWLLQSNDGQGKAETGFTLERAIDERLFTRVLLFCSDSMASQAGKVEVLGSARIIYAPSLAELARQADHKRRLWTQLLTHGWCSPRR